MCRTYRSRGERHDYDWVLRDYRWVNGTLVPFLTDAFEGRSARDFPLSLRRVLDAAPTPATTPYSRGDTGTARGELAVTGPRLERDPRGAQPPQASARTVSWWRLTGPMVNNMIVII